MKDFTFKVYNRRWNSNLKYKIKKTDDGWHISHIAINGNCEPDGKHLFYANFDQDYITYPKDFGYYLEYLWGIIDNSEIDWNEAQQKLQELADWVSLCEREGPKWEGWNC